MSKLDRFIAFMPKELKPATNPVLNALLAAWAGADDEIMQQLDNTKAQLFIKTAEGTYLDRLASNVGVSRPFSLGLLDADFQNLIPNLSFKQKQITKSFYDTMDVFWGPLFSRANATGSLNEPFAITPGDTFQLKADSGVTQTVTLVVGDIRIPGAATVDEVVRFLGKFDGITAENAIDPSTGQKRLNIRTNTPGPRGSIEFLSGFTLLGFAENVKNIITDLDQRTVLYQVRPGEILIELPAVVPTLRRTLKGSHHFHADATLESAIPPANGIWQGSFVYSENSDPFVVTSTRTTLNQVILKGDVLNEITVASTAGFPPSGKLMLNFGNNDQEFPVDYVGIANPNTILVNPGYSFQATHNSGISVNLLLPNQTTPYKPRIDGTDLAIYLTSPANARDVVETILRSLAAAGIVVNFLVLLPRYRYLLQNPFAI